jgi:hypothetical protein
MSYFVVNIMPAAVVQIVPQILITFLVCFLCSLGLGFLYFMLADLLLVCHQI